MDTIKIRNLALLVGLVLNFIACSAETTILNEQSMEKKELDTLKNKVLTISKVKTPWYGFRFLVVGRFRKSIPEYAAVKGLNHKSYHLLENRDYFGGIYLWKSEEDAKAWFNTEWFERVEKTYGEKGIVEYYEITQTETLTDISQPNANYWSVISFYKNEIEMDKKATGLLKIVSVINPSGEKGFVTLWEDKKAAHDYFDKTNYDNTFFDTPILLNNVKQ